MCIGIPMQVLSSEPGYAAVSNRGQIERVSTTLVGAVDTGDWLLVFLGDAKERISASRAQEVMSTLDLLHAAMRGDSDAASIAANFDLPSTLSADFLTTLSGKKT